MKTCYGLFFIVTLCMACGRKDTASSETADSTAVHSTATPARPVGDFAGEYLVGDGSWFISHVGDVWEMRNAPGAEPLLLYKEGIEQDTLHVYALEDHSIIFKMNPGHEVGMYYESDEQWPVSRMQSSARPSGEQANDAEQILRERHQEDELAYANLSSYDGVYAIQTESEGVSASLKLRYEGERVFAFELVLEVSGVCTGTIKDKFVMDRTQHGFYDREGCNLHFNLVEGGVEIDEPAGCKLMKGECTFTSTWVRSE